MKSLYELSQEIKATKPKEPPCENQKCPARTDGRCCVTWDAATNTWNCIFCYAGHNAIEIMNAAAVQKQIYQDKTIKIPEAKLIHRLLRGRRKNNGTKISKENI